MRAVNMGIDLFDCSDRDIDRACRLVKEKIVRLASPLVEMLPGGIAAGSGYRL